MLKESRSFHVMGLSHVENQIRLNPTVALFPHRTLIHSPEGKETHETVCIGQTHSRFLLQRVSPNHFGELRFLY